VPYYEAGAAYAPYGEGYFVGVVATQSVFLAPAVGPGDGGSGHGWDGFGGGGHEGGGIDGGGMDGGGA
jgi:hypothetical protein